MDKFDKITHLAVSYSLAEVAGSLRACNKKRASFIIVIPAPYVPRIKYGAAKAGIQTSTDILDSRLRGNDGMGFRIGTKSLSGYYLNKDSTTIKVVVYLDSGG